MRNLRLFKALLLIGVLLALLSGSGNPLVISATDKPCPQHPEAPSEPNRDGGGEVAFAPDGETALTAFHDGSASLWDAQTGKLLHCLDGNQGSIVYGVAYSPDSKTVITGALYA